MPGAAELRQVRVKFSDSAVRWGFPQIIVNACAALWLLSKLVEPAQPEQFFDRLAALAVRKVVKERPLFGAASFLRGHSFLSPSIPHPSRRARARTSG